MSETFAQAVERLKNNEKPFGLLSLEDQETIRKLTPENTIVFEGKGWVDSQNVTGVLRFDGEWTYRPRPDYQPEPEKPEYIDCEIFSRCHELRCYVNGRDLLISHLSSLSDFRGFFFYDDGPVEVPLDWVARRRAEGKLVVAKFEKGK